MELIETTISEDSVRMCFANEQEPSKATGWIDFQVPLHGLNSPTSANTVLGDPQLRFLEEIQRAALRYVRDAITDEIDVRVSLANRRRQRRSATAPAVAQWSFLNWT
jgi:hypothetical protein